MNPFQYWAEIISRLMSKLKRVREPELPNPLDTYLDRFRNTLMHGDTTVRRHYDDDATEYLTDAELYAILYHEYSRLQNGGDQGDIWGNRITEAEFHKNFLNHFEPTDTEN